jgi:NAD(P)-dependent dehydrogenase (short-subunit alcohol dehydrogenase family)
VVTGAASGIGRATAELLAARGRPVALADVDGDRAQAVAREIAGATGVAVAGYAMDVRSADALASGLAAARRDVGPLSGLVHAAGTSGPTPIDDLTAEGWARLLDVHLGALPVLVQAMLADLRSAPGAAVVGIGSLASFVGFEVIPAYCAAKSGLRGLCRSLALALGRDGIRVNLVCPGYIETPMMEGSLATEEGRARFADAAALGRLGTATDIARAVCFLLSEEASFVTGTELVVDGGVLARSV